MDIPYRTGKLQYEYVPFPELGHGSQFHTYDTHDGRVLKLPLTKEETYTVVSKRRHNMNPLSTAQTAPLETRIHTIINGKSRIPAMINHSFYDAKDFLSILGNPAIIDATHVLPEDKPGKQWGAGRVIYTQDRLAMVGDMLSGFARCLSRSNSSRSGIGISISSMVCRWNPRYSETDKLWRSTQWVTDSLRL